MKGNYCITLINQILLAVLASILIQPSITIAAENTLNCKKAFLKVEKLICSDDKLKHLDFQLNVQYKNILMGLDRDPAFIQSQKTASSAESVGRLFVV